MESNVSKEPALAADPGPDQAKIDLETPTPMPLSAIVVFDIDGVVREVSGSYLRALADTVEYFTQGAYRPTLAAVDRLKAEGLWNNDWDASQELVYRFFEKQGLPRSALALDYADLVDFFQARYRGQNWDGYIQDEPLLLRADYLKDLTAAQIGWGFFSGATRGSATYVLEARLGLQSPVLIAMEDAPGKPDPTGLIAAVAQLTAKTTAATTVPALYVGDTVADLQTVERARELQPTRTWIGVGIIPPHVDDRNLYREQLQKAGAALVLDQVEQLTASEVLGLIKE